MEDVQWSCWSVWTLGCRNREQHCSSWPRDQTAALDFTHTHGTLDAVHVGGGKPECCLFGLYLRNESNANNKSVRLRFFPWFCLSLGHELLGSRQYCSTKQMLEHSFLSLGRMEVEKVVVFMQPNKPSPESAQSLPSLARWPGGEGHLGGFHHSQSGVGSTPFVPPIEGPTGSQNPAEGCKQRAKHDVITIFGEAFYLCGVDIQIS